MNITEFLEARIAEDEAVARATLDGQRCWEVDEESYAVASSNGDGICYDTASLAASQHIARHDPARVLAECAAKRAVLELHRLYIHTDAEPGFSMTLWECMCNRQTGKPCPTVGALAAVYADHEDYREEWALP